MHILYVADGDSKYGAPHSLFQLISEIKKIDPSIKVSIALTKNSDRAEDYKKAGCDVYRVSYEPFCQGIPYEYWKIPIKLVFRGILYLYGRCVSIRQLEKQLDMEEVDLIHSNSSREDFGARIAGKYGIPLIWHIREFGDLDYHCFHYLKNYIGLMNQTATEMIAVSKAVKEHWVSKGILESKITSIYNGVKEKKQVKKQYPKEKDMIRLVMLGLLNWAKGQHQIIKAMAALTEDELKRVRLDIVGDGTAEYTHTLKRLIRENHLEEQVSLLGYQKDFDRNLYRYDCGIMCSKCEGFGRVTAEYMMAGLPVIASDTGANPELIKDKFNGLLYRYNDIGDLADKIRYLLNHEDLIEEFGRNAYSCAAEKYTISFHALKIYEEYKKVLKEKRN